jgi:hypothetical protein
MRTCSTKHDAYGLHEPHEPSTCRSIRSEKETSEPPQKPSSQETLKKGHGVADLRAAACEDLTEGLPWGCLDPAGRCSQAGRSRHSLWQNP